jgi:hypothetical protein
LAGVIARVARRDGAGAPFDACREQHGLLDSDLDNRGVKI